MRRPLCCGPFVLAAMTLLVALTMPVRLCKAEGNLYWDGTGTSWNTASFWSTSSSATTPDPAAKPSPSDNAHFNITTVNTAQTVNLNGAQSAVGLVFESAGPVVIQTGSGTNTLTLGDEGIRVIAGAGADTVSTAVTLAPFVGGESWTNNSTNLLTVSGTVSNLQGFIFHVGGSGNITLSGSVNTANTVLTKIDSGTLTLSGSTDNNSLPVTVNGGTVVLAKTSSGSPNEVHAIGQDALTVSGGTAQLGGTGGDQIYDLGSVIVTSGAFDTNARNETFSALNLQGTGIGGAGALVNTAASASTITPTNGTTLTADTTIGVTQSSGNLTLNNAVSGAFAITKTGLGTLVLNGTNNFSGGVTVTAGTLIGGSNQALGTGTLTINGGAVDLGAFAPGVNIDLMAGSLSFTGNLTVGTGGLLGSNLILNADRQLALSGTTTVDASRTLTLSGGTLTTASLVVNGAFNFIAGTLTITQAGASINTPIVSGASSTINLSANNVSLGLASSFTGFNYGGVLNLGANNLTLNSAAYAQLGVLTTLAGGTISAPNGVYLSGGGNLVGNGAVNARVTGDTGSVIQATGALAFGDASSPAGFSYAGELRTKQFTVTLNSSGVAGLGNLTTLGSAASPGALTATNGYVVDFDEAVTGYGTINSTNTLAKHATINGTVQGTSPAQPITLSGYIKGTGSFTNVIFTGTHDPGLSPTLLSVGNVGYASTALLNIELGGTTRGRQYDAIVASGNLSLSGVLQLSLINGFIPVAGNSFDILDWNTLSGTFSSLSLPTLGSELTWNTSQLYTAGVLSVAATVLAGDYNGNGIVDAADYTVWRDKLGSSTTLPNDTTPGSVTQADYDVWKANFGSHSGASAGANAAVPEPATLLMLFVGLLTVCASRQQKCRKLMRP